ncbi:DUF177 domain-containing protein [bacterium]|nr:MAG: DUF177 domain-containing protein [bacterium]
MRVDVGRILGNRGASLAIQGAISLPGELGLGYRTTGPAQVRATMTNTGRFLHAEGRIEIGLRAECVRCLKEFDLVLKVPLAQDYLPPGESLLDEESVNDFAPLTGEFLDLDPAVSEAVFLALPMKPLCRDDCLGLCAQCGQNLNEGQCGCDKGTGHPGLAALARLLSEKEV